MHFVYLKISAIESKRDDQLKVIQDRINEFGIRNRQHCDLIKEHQQEAKRLCAATHKISLITQDSKLIEEFAAIKDQVNKLMTFKATLLHPQNYELQHTGEMMYLN